MVYYLLHKFKNICSNLRHRTERIFGTRSGAFQTQSSEDPFSNVKTCPPRNETLPVETITLRTKTNAERTRSKTNWVYIRFFCQERNAYFIEKTAFLKTRFYDINSILYQTSSDDEFFVLPKCVCLSRKCCCDEAFLNY